MSSKNSDRRPYNPKRLVSLTRNYTPNVTQARFHTDHDSPIKIIVGGQATGTSTALAIEMLMCEGCNNLLVVRDFAFFKTTLERTLKQWCRNYSMQSTDEIEGVHNGRAWGAVEVTLNGYAWRVVGQKYLRQVLAREPEYDNVAVAGVPFDNHAVFMLAVLSEHCKGSGQVFGVFKPAVEMLPDLFDIAEYRYPPLFVAQDGELAVNPALETWHMPNGSGYFEDLLRLNYNTYAEAYGVGPRMGDTIEFARAPRAKLVAFSDSSGAAKRPDYYIGLSDTGRGAVVDIVRQATVDVRIDWLFNSIQLELDKIVFGDTVEIPLSYGPGKIVLGPEHMVCFYNHTPSKDCAAVDESDCAEPAMNPEVQALADEYLERLIDQVAGLDAQTLSASGHDALHYHAQAKAFRLAIEHFKTVFNMSSLS